MILIPKLRVADGIFVLKIFDIFSGGNLADELKSVAINFTFQAEYNLSDEEIVDTIEKIKQELKHKFNAELR